jgi:CxxC motif-containing protein (DUF1111 family)
LLENAAPRLPDGSKAAIFGAFLERNSLEDVIASALANELGVSSSKYCASTPVAATRRQDCHPLISDAELDDLVQFVRFLAPPPRKSQGSIIDGERLFHRIRCIQCHTPSLPQSGGAGAPFRALTAMAYTDLRRHDLGNGKGIKTPALWGVTSVGPPYMHDAAASSIDEAILKHQGEAIGAARLYQQLTDSEKELLMRFLKSI